MAGLRSGWHSNVLRRGGMDIEEMSCGGAADLGRAVRERAGTVDIVIVGGGDGTLNCTAPSLIETGLPLGILALGTANDLARTLSIGADPVAAAEIIVAGHERRIDLGEVNGHPFFNVASMGSRPNSPVSSHPI